MADNDAMRPRAGTAAVTALVLLTACLFASGCTGIPPDALDGPGPSAGPTGPVDPQGQLAARAAAGQDRRYTASYALTTDGRVRTVTVTIAQDGTWLVAVPGGGLAGAADVAVAGTRAGLYQCRLGAAAACVRVAAPDGTVPAADDPRVQYLFTSWLRVLTDRQQAIAVDRAPALPGASGQCFSVQANSATLAAPVDAGVYCYDQDGLLTAATLAMGSFVLAGAPAAAPPTVTLPGPVTGAAPVPTAAPPSPTPSADPAG
jgi:hypothetical protein